MLILHTKILRDSWNLRDGFTNLNSLWLVPVLTFFREPLANVKKSAKFVNVSPIILMTCRFISEKNLHLASGTTRRKFWYKTPQNCKMAGRNWRSNRKIKKKTSKGSFSRPDLCIHAAQKCPLTKSGATVPLKFLLLLEGKKNLTNSHPTARDAETLRGGDLGEGWSGR